MKKLYVSPGVEVRRVMLEGVIADSYTATPYNPVYVEDFENGGEYNSDDILIF